MGIEIDGPPCRTCDSLRAALSAARGLLRGMVRCKHTHGEQLCSDCSARIDAFLSPAEPPVPEHPAAGADEVRAAMALASLSIENGCESIDGECCFCPAQREDGESIRPEDHEKDCAWEAFRKAREGGRA